MHEAANIPLIWSLMVGVNLNTEAIACTHVQSSSISELYLVRFFNCLVQTLRHIGEIWEVSELCQLLGNFRCERSGQKT